MVKSLTELCTAVCIKNVRDIWDVGTLPYWVIRPVLLKIENPMQLLAIEESSPNLKGDTAECWQRLVNRDFPHLARKYNYEPRNPTLWSKVYQKYKKLDAELKKEAAAKLNNGFNALKKEKQAKAVPVMNFNARVHGRIPGQRRNGSGFHGLPFGSRPKTTSAQSIMQKARREAREMSRRYKLSTPTGQLVVQQGQIARAPLGMVEEHKNKSRPFARAIQPPSRPVGAHRELEQKEREARLLKAKSGVGTKGATLVSDEDLLAQEDVDSDFDSDGEAGGLTVDGLESMFDENKPSTSASTKPSKDPLMPPQGNNDSLTAPTSSSTAKPGSSNLSGLAQMKRGLSWKNRPMRLEPIETSPPKPASNPTASSSAVPKPSAALSPPLRPLKGASASSPPPGAAASATGSPSADPKSRPRPMVIGQKRKEAPSVFMKPKNKARRMS
ncbi:RNA polymerase II transcription factor SIII subunit A-domain-containing protein [Hypoxylon sp. FL0890]|nr:RNA polymerase II transcription factor SIII subunit A-domain-containing protein [Hypoxylon sp. FL0890]